MIAVAATYVFFLLFAQFGFLELLKSRGLAAGEIEAAMASMGIAGLAASLAAGWLLARVPPPRLLRAAFLGCAASALVALAAHGLPALLAISAAIGISTALLTVALAASLRGLVPGPRFGLAVGAGTGAAYLVCNVPALFEAGPVIQSCFVAAVCLLGLASLRRQPATSETSPERRAGDYRGWGFASVVLTFLLLVWLDSAAFATIQATPALKASTWGSPGQKLAQGVVHLLAALAAGAMIDRGRLRSLLHLTFGLFALAFTMLLQPENGELGMLAGPIYAVGISFYSVALVAYPGSWREQPGLVPRRWRAAVLYGVAGWLGSALGVGMAQHFERHPPAFLVASVVDPVEHGRQVYVAEGCIHCHSQYVREGTRDVALWGPHRDLDRRERPPLPGNRRQGPDLSNVGARRGPVWQRLHLADPRALNPASRMPAYAHLFAAGEQRGEDLVVYLSSLGAGAREDWYALTQSFPVADLARAPAAGRGLFRSYCVPCHGNEGRGDGPLAPAVFRPAMDLRKGAFWLVSWGPGAEPKTQALARLIRFGVPGTEMPGHEYLSDRQVADLSAYVLDLAGS